MTTGLQMFDAVKAATQNDDPGVDFRIYSLDALDLRKLTPPKLQVRGYDEAVAEEVSTALAKGDLGPLGRTMGIRFVFDENARRLLATD